MYALTHNFILFIYSFDHSIHPKFFVCVILRSVSNSLDGEPARVGLQLQLDGQFERVAWLGRGPGECYPDRKAGSPVGVWTSTVDNMHVPYIYPSEVCGLVAGPCLTLSLPSFAKRFCVPKKSKI